MGGWLVGFSLLASCDEHMQLAGEKPTELDCQGTISCHNCIINHIILNHHEVYCNILNTKVHVANVLLFLQLSDV